MMANDSTLISLPVFLVYQVEEILEFHFISSYFLSLFVYFYYCVIIYITWEFQEVEAAWISN